MTARQGFESIPSQLMQIGSLAIYRERPGVISQGPAYVLIYRYWMYVEGDWFRLFLHVWKDWKSDRQIVG